MRGINLILILFVNFSISFAQNFECEGSFDEQTTFSMNCAQQGADYIGSYKKIEAYQLTSETAIKTVKIAFHIWLDGNGQGCWNETQQTQDDLYQIADWMNAFYQYLNPNSTANYHPSSFSDSRIRIELEGIYFYHENHPNF